MTRCILTQTETERKLIETIDIDPYHVPDPYEVNRLEIVVGKLVGNLVGN